MVVVGALLVAGGLRLGLAQLNQYAGGATFLASALGLLGFLGACGISSFGILVALARY